MTPFDPNTLATVALASVGAATTALVYVVRLEGRMTAHEQTDIIVHQNVSQGIAELKATALRTEAQVDKLIERFML